MSLLLVLQTGALAVGGGWAYAAKAAPQARATVVTGDANVKQFFQGPVSKISPVW
jgi:hypothetical protein